MANYIFVRHGQTDWNIEGRWQGHSNTNLNETGFHQAQNAAEILRDTHFSAVYSSDLLRAMNTAIAINQYHGHTIIEEPRLREQHLGKWEGLYVKEVPDKYPELWQKFIDYPIETVITDGESLQQLVDRMWDFYLEKEKMHQPDESILVVAHGLSLAVLLCKLNGLPLTEAYKQIPANATPIFFSGKIIDQPQ